MKILEKTIFNIGFIYNHIGALSIMREFTSNTDLVRYNTIDLLLIPIIAKELTCKNTTIEICLPYINK